MIGADVAEKLFPDTTAMGKIINVDGEEFEVVGVAKRIGNTLAQSQDNFAYIPVETWLKMYGRNNSLSASTSRRAARNGWPAPRKKPGC